MTDVTSTRTEIAPNAGMKIILLESGTTVTGATDTLTLTLANFGCSQILAFQEYVHTTDYSVIASEVATSAVSAGVLTITTTTGNNNKRRIVTVFAR